jgi:RNA polymerase sigma factor (TIGR02999 family)
MGNCGTRAPGLSAGECPRRIPARMDDTPHRPIHAAALTTRLHGELRALAAAKLRNAVGPRSVQATALVHEAWVKLRDDGTFADRGAFFGAAARAMKDVLIDRLRARLAKKRGGGQPVEDVDEAAIEVEPALPIADLLSLDTALERLQRDHPDEAEVVLRRFFGGQTNADIAADLGCSERTIERRWRFARAMLASELGGGQDPQP